MNITFQSFMKTTSKDQYTELLAKKTSTGLDIHCWHVENSSATMNSNCEVYPRRYQQSRICFKVIQFPFLPCQRLWQLHVSERDEQKISQMSLPRWKNQCHDRLHSLCPLHAALERSKNNGCRSQVGGVGVLSSQYEKYFVRPYRNQHSN
jgi:hypothetical protein